MLIFSIFANNLVVKNLKDEVLFNYYSYSGSFDSWLFETHYMYIPKRLNINAHLGQIESIKIAKVLIGGLVC